MNSLGLPIVGDNFYPTLLDTPRDDYSDPLQLLAKSIEFDDPFTGERRFRVATGWRWAATSRSGRTSDTRGQPSELISWLQPDMRSLVQDYIDGVYRDLTGERSGSVADYIPELAVVDPDSFAICLATSDGYVYEAGDSRKRFAIQSISKPFSYALALADRGLAAVAEQGRRRTVGRAVQRDQPRPGHGAAAQPDDQRGRDHVPRPWSPATPSRNGSSGSGRSTPGSPAATWRWTRRCSSRRTAPGTATGPSATCCAASASSTEDPQTTLGRVLPAVLDRGRLPRPEPDGRDAGRQRRPPGDAASGCSTPALNERVLSVMTTCGMYNAAGDWVTEVGLPAKSGVGGGILAVLPGQIGLAVFSPAAGRARQQRARCRRVPPDLRDLELHMMHVSRAARSAVRASYTVIESPSRRPPEPGRAGGAAGVRQARRRSTSCTATCCSRAPSR